MTDITQRLQFQTHAVDATRARAVDATRARAVDATALSRPYKTTTAMEADACGRDRAVASTGLVACGRDKDVASTGLVACGRDRAVASTGLVACGRDRAVASTIAAAILAFFLAVPALFAETNAQHLSIPNVIGVHKVTSSLEYLPLAVCYGETAVESNLPANVAQHATNLVFTANLAADDRLFVYDHARKGYVTYLLDASKHWQPDTVFAASHAGKDLEPVGAQMQAWGYGFWLYRPEASNRTDKAVYLAGQVPVGEVSVTLAATVTASGKTTFGKTLIGNPLGAAWNLNDTSVFDWSTVAKANDHIQLNNDKATLFYWKTNRKTKKMEWTTVTANGGDAVIPAGASFWYVRGSTGTTPVTVKFRTGL